MVSFHSRSVPAFQKEHAGHFEQVYGRAKTTLNNALTAFDDAKDVTRLMRSEQDSLISLQTRVGEQELAYTFALIELFGTPYPDDIGPGKSFAAGYTGPETVLDVGDAFVSAVHAIEKRIEHVEGIFDAHAA